MLLRTERLFAADYSWCTQVLNSVTGSCHDRQSRIRTWSQLRKKQECKHKNQITKGKTKKQRCDLFHRVAHLVFFCPSYIYLNLLFLCTVTSVNQTLFMYSNVVPVMQFVSARDLHYRIEG